MLDSHPLHAQLLYRNLVTDTLGADSIAESQSLTANLTATTPKQAALRNISLPA